MDKKRIDRMKALRKQGLSYAEVGAIYGISRQRVHQILDKNYLKKRKELFTSRKKGT